MKTPIWFPLVLLLLFLAACGGSADPTLDPPPTEQPAQESQPANPSNPKLPASASEATLGKPFSLNVGETVAFREIDLSLTFETILEDSRCPTNVTCVHAGWATAQLSGSYGGEPLGEVILTVPGRRPEQSNTLELNGLTIHLETITPYPVDPGLIDPGSYAVTLLLEITK